MLRIIASSTTAQRTARRERELAVLMLEAVCPRRA
jgi:hypothetical protein